MTIRKGTTGMRISRTLGVLAVGMLAAGSAVRAGAQGNGETAGKAATRPAAARKQKPRAPADVPGLPRVLIIGDSISMGYTRPVQELLKGKANGHRIPGNAQHTGTGLERLDAWLGEGKWDVIHFNWGLWDLCYRNPQSKTQGNRDKVDGKITFTLEQYEKNLAELVRRLKATRAKLIWATITPVPEGEAGRVRGDEVRYNAAARKIMLAHGVAINDLHAHLLPKFEQFASAPGNVHLKPEGYRFLAEKVAASILEALGEEPAATTRPSTRPARPGSGVQDTKQARPDEPRKP